jgi:hypothetical protein
MKALPFLLSFILVSCSFTTEIVTDIVILHPTSLSIVSKNGNCFFRIEGIPDRLIAPKPPCHFMRKSDNKIQHYSYSDVNVEDVFIIVGTPISTQTREEWGLTEKLVCGKEAQGILLKKGIFHITKNFVKGGVLCKDIGLDEKNFWHFAHEN